MPTSATLPPASTHAGALNLREITDWPNERLAQLDILEVHLSTIQGLPGTGPLNIAECIRRVDEGARAAERRTNELAHLFRRRPADFKNSWALFRCMALSTALQEHFRTRMDLKLNTVEPHVLMKDVKPLGVHAVLDGDTGTCLTLTILYVALGRRLGYPLKLVRTHQHMFARWDEPGERFNIECTVEGFDSPEDEHYLEWPKPLTPEEVQYEGFLRSLSPREELAEFMFHRALYLTLNNRFREAVLGYIWASNLAPDTWRLRDILEEFVKGWRLSVNVRMPPLFPELRILMPPKRKFPDSIPVETEREVLILGVIESLMELPKYQAGSSFVGWGATPPVFRGVVEVQCE